MAKSIRETGVRLHHEPVAKEQPVKTGKKTKSGDYTIKDSFKSKRSEPRAGIYEDIFGSKTDHLDSSGSITSSPSKEESSSSRDSSVDNVAGNYYNPCYPEGSGEIHEL